MLGATDDRLNGGQGNDILFGGLFADTFVFDAAAGGTDQVAGLDRWDRLEFNGFGYAGAAEAVARMRTDGDDVIFADQGVNVIFHDRALSFMDEVTILV